MSNLLLKHLAQKTMKNKNKKKYKKSKGWFLEERGVMAAVFAEYSVHRPWRIYKKKKKKERKRKRNKSRITRRLGCRTRNSWSCRIHIRWWNRSNVLVVTVVTNATLNVTIQQGPVLRLCFKSGSEFFTSCCFVCQKDEK